MNDKQLARRIARARELQLEAREGERTRRLRQRGEPVRDCFKCQTPRAKRWSRASDGGTLWTCDVCKHQDYHE